MRGGVSLALKFPQNQRGTSPSSVAPAVLTHVQAVEQNYKLAMEAERWAENGERRDLLRVQTDRYADILERFGIPARLDRVVTALGASTGGMDWAEGFRNINILPLVASRNRRSVLRDLQYWMMHVVGRPVRYGVVTFGANVDLYGPLRETIQAGQRRISKWAAWARDEFGINVAGRFGEMTVNEGLSFHPHANVIYWLDAPIPKDRWRAFLTGSWSRFGARWKDNGIVHDASEIVKYFAKGDDLSLLADMSCHVRGWADREVPKAALIEAMACKIAAKRSDVEGRAVRAEECWGYADKAVSDGIVRLREWAAEGKEHPLVWLFHQMHRLHLVQSMGGLQSFRRDLDLDGKKVAFIATDDGSPILQQVRKSERKKADNDESGEKEEKRSDPPLIVENRVIAVTMPQPRFSPWAEEIIYVENFTASPRTESGCLGLWRIQQIQEKARSRWEAAGSPDPLQALAIAARVRPETRQGGTRALRGGCLPGLDACGPGDGEAGAGAGSYRSHHNENCPEKNSSQGVRVLPDGSVVDRESGVIVYRPLSYSELCLVLDVEGAIQRAASVGPENKSLWWKLRNLDAWLEMERKGISWNEQEWPEGYFINDDDLNFFGVDAADGGCDIPF